MANLSRHVALVTGASRGLGKGIALALGEAGATVYITGRTVEPGTGPDGLLGTVLETADAVEERGGRAIAIPCDHRDDAQVEAIFNRSGRVLVAAAVAREYGITDIDGSQPHPLSLTDD